MKRERHVKTFGCLGNLSSVTGEERMTSFATARRDGAGVDSARHFPGESKYPCSKHPKSLSVQVPIP